MFRAYKTLKISAFSFVFLYFRPTGHLTKFNKKKARLSSRTGAPWYSCFVVVFIRYLRVILSLKALCDARRDSVSPPSSAAMRHSRSL